MLTRTLLAVLLVASIGLAQSDQHFSISGRIIGDLDHQGVSGARVALTGGSVKGVPPVSVTNASGGFSFTDVDAGKYRLAVDHPDYLPQGSPEITVTSGSLQVGDLISTKKRPMGGVVRWKDGEPVAGAQVTVMGYRGGHYSRAPNGGTQLTNEKGEYLYPGALPRHYIIFAFVPYNQNTPDVAPRVAAPRFYPSVESPDQATILSMRTVPEFRQADIILDDEPGGDIQGTVSSTYYPAGTQVQLGLTVPNVSMTSYLVSTIAKVGESFKLPAVPPGNYILMANTRRVAPNQQDNSLDVYQFTIRPGEPLKGLNVVVSEPASVVGKVLLEEPETPTSNGGSGGTTTAQKLSPSPRFGFQFEVGDLQSYGLLPGSPNADGEFKAIGAVRGMEYKLSPGMNLPCDCYVARMKQGDKDLQAGALPVIAGVPFEMILRKDGGSVSGKVSEDNKTPDKAFVVLAPQNRPVEYWYRKNYTLPDGTFKLTNVAPGDYDLFAFDRDEDTQYLDEKFLLKYAGSSVHVTVQPKAAVSADVKMVRMP